MKRLEYKYIVAIVFVFGLFMDLLDMTITNVALPTLGRQFSASTTTIEWVVTGYLLSLAVFIPVSGWVGDRFGTKRTFMFALTVFAISSLLCGLAWNIESLIAFRVLQGVGGGMLTPVGTAMLFRAFPPAERARASAILSIPTVIAPATGPVLGGYLVEFQNWRWIFLVNVPIAILGLVIAGLYLREHTEPNAGRLDVPGFLLAAPGLAAVVYALAEAGQRGFGDSRVLLFGISGITALVAFVFVELRSANPMLDVRLFHDKLFASTNAVQFVSQAGLGGVLFLLPLFLQAEKGLTPLQSGLTTFPQAFGVTIMAAIAGRIYGRVGPRRMMMLGLFLSSLTTLAFLRVDLDTGQWIIRGLMFARGLAFGMILIPMQAATFATIRPQDTGRASAAFNSVRQVAASFGVALLATALTNRMGNHGAQLGNPATRAGALLAFHDAFFFASMITLAGIAAAALVDDRLAARTMSRGRPGAAEGDERVPAGVH